MGGLDAENSRFLPQHCDTHTDITDTTDTTDTKVTADTTGAPERRHKAKKS